MWGGKVNREEVEDSNERQERNPKESEKKKW
jgi:hypothetical protein